MELLVLLVGDPILHSKIEVLKCYGGHQKPKIAIILMETIYWNLRHLKFPYEHSRHQFPCIRHSDRWPTLWLHQVDLGNQLDKDDVLSDSNNGRDSKPRRFQIYLGRKLKELFIVHYNFALLDVLCSNFNDFSSINERFLGQHMETICNRNSLDPYRKLYAWTKKSIWKIFSEWGPLLWTLQIFLRNNL